MAVLCRPGAQLTRTLLALSFHRGTVVGVRAVTRSLSLWRVFLLVALALTTTGCALEETDLPSTSPTGRYDDPSDLRALGVYYLELSKAEVFTPSTEYRRQEVLGVLAADTLPWVRAAKLLEAVIEPGLVLTIEGAPPTRAVPDLSDGGVTLELVGPASFCTVRVLLVESADLRFNEVVEQMGCQTL